LVEKNSKTILHQEVSKEERDRMTNDLKVNCLRRSDLCDLPGSILVLVDGTEKGKEGLELALTKKKRHVFVGMFYKKIKGFKWSKQDRLVLNHYVYAMGKFMMKKYEEIIENDESNNMEFSLIIERHKEPWEQLLTILKTWKIDIIIVACEMTSNPKQRSQSMRGFPKCEEVIML